MPIIVIYKSPLDYISTYVTVSEEDSLRQELVDKGIPYVVVGTHENTQDFEDATKSNNEITSNS